VTGATARRFFRSRWTLAFLTWTALIAVQVIPLWPAATAPFPPCVYQGADRPDPSLPVCPPDNANYEAIGVFLLLLVWLGGIGVLFVAFAVSRLAGRARSQR
jgi:Trk-type K+ transport system membrane component